MLARVARLATYAQDAEMKAAGRQALTRVTAQAAGGVAKHADRIYVLRDGQVIEQGVHADLLALGGQYAELFTLQAAQYNL